MAVQHVQPRSPDGEDTLWALHGLAARGGESVMMVGQVTTPGGGPVGWQYALAAESLLDEDWADWRRR